MVEPEQVKHGRMEVVHMDRSEAGNRRGDLQYCGSSTPGHPNGETVVIGFPCVGTRLGQFHDAFFSTPEHQGFLKVPAP